MKKRRSFKPIARQNKKQIGEALLDAIIAMLLAMVVGLGPVYIASRGAVAQTQASYKNMVVLEMRKLLDTPVSTLCGTPPQITVNQVGNSTAVLSLPVTVSCTTRVATGIVIGGRTVNPTGTLSAQTISLSVTDSAMFGGGGTITITQGGA